MIFMFLLWPTHIEEDAHSPTERVEVKTVESFWVFFKALLAKL